MDFIRQKVLILEGLGKVGLLYLRPRSAVEKKEIELADWDVLTLVYNLPRTIRFARIRCMPREEIIKEVLKAKVTT